MDRSRAGPRSVIEAPGARRGRAPRRAPQRRCKALRVSISHPGCSRGAERTARFVVSFYPARILGARHFGPSWACAPWAYGEHDPACDIHDPRGGTGFAASCRRQRARSDLVRGLQRQRHSSRQRSWSVPCPAPLSVLRRACGQSASRPWADENRNPQGHGSRARPGSLRNTRSPNERGSDEAGISADFGDDTRTGDRLR